MASSSTLTRSRRASSTKVLAKIIVRYLDTQIARPSLKAFLFAYLYVVLPRVFNAVISAVQKKNYHRLWSRVGQILTHALHPLKFPMFAAKLVTGINVLEPMVYHALRRARLTHPVQNLFVSTLVSSFISALVTFPVFQNHIVGYGRYFSLDLTLLVATRAVDTVLSSSLVKVIPSRVSNIGDGLLFIVSCQCIMFSWFYNPELLPPSYSRWITSAANMDPELIYVLREMREGKAKYGKDRSNAHLKAYCENHGQDIKHGDLVLNQPLSCRTVHAFQTDSCELHALWRFARGFSFAIKIYGPLNAMMLLVPRTNMAMRLRIIHAIRSSIRSSCFLGSFIALFWYAVCLARTRLFPHLFPKVSRTRFDDTIGPAFGSILCGVSCFIESAQRRKELALFVAPRALGTFISKAPTAANLRKESIVFSISMAVLIAFSRSDPKKVRGFFGKGIQHVFKVQDYI